METSGAERALARMRRYTSWSLVLMTAFFVVISAVGTTSTWYRIALILVGAGATYYISWWERMPPLWLTVPLVAAASALWTVSVFLLQSPISALVLFIIAMVPISQLRRHRTALALLSVVLALVPVAVAWLVWPEKLWVIPAVSAVACAGAAAFLLFLNRYAWGLYL